MSEGPEVKSGEREDPVARSRSLVTACVATILALGSGGCAAVGGALEVAAAVAPVAAAAAPAAVIGYNAGQIPDAAARSQYLSTVMNGMAAGMAGSPIPAAQPAAAATPRAGAAGAGDGMLYDIVYQHPSKGPTEMKGLSKQQADEVLKSTKMWTSDSARETNNRIVRSYKAPATAGAPAGASYAGGATAASGAQMGAALARANGAPAIRTGPSSTARRSDSSYGSRPSYGSGYTPAPSPSAPAVVGAGPAGAAPYLSGRGGEAAGAGGAGASAARDASAAPDVPGGVAAGGFPAGARTPGAASGSLPDPFNPFGDAAGPLASRARPSGDATAAAAAHTTSGQAATAVSGPDRNPFLSPSEPAPSAGSFGSPAGDAAPAARPESQEKNPFLSGVRDRAGQVVESDAFQTIKGEAADLHNRFNKNNAASLKESGDFDVWDSIKGAVAGRLEDKAKGDAAAIARDMRSQQKFGRNYDQLNRGQRVEVDAEEAGGSAVWSRITDGWEQGTSWVKKNAKEGANWMTENLEKFVPDDMVEDLTKGRYD